MIKRFGTLCKKLHLMKLNLASSAGIQEGMQVLDVGCGQGTFTVCVAEVVGRTGKVTAVDISDEEVNRMNQNIDRYGVRPQVVFVKADAAELSTVFAPESFDMAVSYRLIEELVPPRQLPKIVSSIAGVVKRDGTVAMLELNTETSNIAEENLITLHRDIGNDYFPSQRTVLKCMKTAGLMKLDVVTVPTNISYSGKVFLESNISQDEVWPEFKEKIMRELWPSVEQYGMKYPSIRLFRGHKR
jgi:ubiquinone/menaquinone biosynthesis C-methylase UbiE